MPGDHRRAFCCMRVGGDVGLAKCLRRIYQTMPLIIVGRKTKIEPAHYSYCGWKTNSAHGVLFTEHRHRWSVNTHFGEFEIK